MDRCAQGRILPVEGAAVAKMEGGKKFDYQYWNFIVVSVRENRG